MGSQVAKAVDRKPQKPVDVSKAMEWREGGLPTWGGMSFWPVWRTLYWGVVALFGDRPKWMLTGCGCCFGDTLPFSGWFALYGKPEHEWFTYDLSFKQEASCLEMGGLMTGATFSP